MTVSGLWDCGILSDLVGKRGACFPTEVPFVFSETWLAFVGLSAGFVGVVVYHSIGLWEHRNKHYLWNSISAAQPTSRVEDLVVVLPRCTTSH